MTVSVGKLASNSDSQNKGQGKDPKTIRGEIVLDPFRERKVSFNHKLKGKKGEEKTPVFSFSVRGVFTRELSPSSNLEDVIADAQKVTRLDGLSLIAVRTAFKTWQNETKNRETRLERIALVQGEEIELANLVRFAVSRHIHH